MRNIPAAIALVLWYIAWNHFFPAHTDGQTQLAFWNIAIPFAVSMGSKLLGGGKKDDGQGDRVQNRFLSYLNPQQKRADTAQNYYLDEMMDYDPREALQEYGDAAASSFKRTLDRSVADLGGKSVGAGRLDTGFYDLDQGELVGDLASRYDEAFASRALDASQQNLQRLGQLGSFGQNAGNTYLDMLSGQMDRDTARKNANKKMWSDLLGAGMGAAATYFGSRGG